MKRTLLALTLLASPAVALAVPAQLTTQGRILDADDAPLDGAVDVSFRLMDSETGGNTLWEETQSVDFTNGFYAVMLGADEEVNPLEDSVLEQWPLYLEVQLDGEPAMVPRMSIGSVPYARQAGVAEELAAGADIDAGSLTVNGTEVVTADGEWSGATPDVDWSDLTGIPGEFADEDDADTLAGLVCSDGQWAVWDGDSAAWSCDGFSDTTLTDPDVVVAVGTDVVDLYAGSTMDGYTLLTEDSELAWANLTGVPSGLMDGDDDTLGALSCTDGQIAVYDTSAVAWICGDDTDNMLTPTEVVAAVEAAAALALPDATTVGGDAVITTTDTVAWSQLSSVPTGLSDGDDDTLGALSCSGDAIPVYSGSAWTCGTDTDNTLTPTEVVAAVNAAAAVAMTGTLSVGGYAVLTENSTVGWSQLTGVPTGLADGDDDTLAGLGCADGEVATYDSSTGWGCANSGGATTSATSGFTTIAIAGSTTASTSTGMPATSATALVDDGSGYIHHIELGDYVECTACGTGADGAWTVSTAVTSTSIVGGEYNFTDFTLPSGVMLTVTGSSPLIIRATGDVEIAGTIDVSGEDGYVYSSTGSTAGGTGTASGQDGTAGQTSGVNRDGTDGDSDSEWAAESLTDVTAVAGGEGGTGNVSVYGSRLSGGGAGGGAVAVVAPRIVVSGAILADGGTAGGSPCAGAGGGGAIWLRGSTIEVSGTLTADAGAACSVATAGDGAVRVDAYDVTDLALDDRIQGSLEGIPRPIDLYQDTSGTITLTNHSPSSISVDLRVVE